jgi:hypothetical protein
MVLYPDPKDVLYYEGKTFTVEWYYAESGRLPALDYYSQLREIDQDRLDAMVKYLADSPPGTRLPQTIFRIEDRENKIYALKSRDERFFNFTTEGAKIILTNAYHKHSQKMTRLDLEQLKVAVEYRKDYLRRLREGTYYEA